MESADDEYEEEEVIVLAELNGLVDDELMKKGCSYQFVGIENEKPVLQLGKYNFLGDYEDQIGSALFLQETTSSDGRKAWSKLCFSDKKLAMQRVFLRKKGEELPAASGAPPPAASAAAASSAMEQDSAAEPAPGAAQESDPLAVTAEDMAEYAGADQSAAAAADLGTDVDMQSAEHATPAEVARETAASQPSGEQ